MTDGQSEIMLALKSGRAIRFPEDKVRPTGRGAIGVTGIEVDDSKDEVIGMVCVNAADKSRTVLVVSEKGYGKRTPVDEYRITNRGGKGVKTINVTEKTGNLVGILDVSEKEDLMITCVSGITIRMSIAQISELGRNTQGVKLIKIDNDDEIAAITNLDEDKEIQAEENPELPQSDPSLPKTDTTETDTTETNTTETDTTETDTTETDTTETDTTETDTTETDNP
jgi:DNA gyrase subunit A